MARGGKRGRRGNAVTVKPNFGVETTKAPEQEDTGGLVFDQRDSFDGNVITIFTGPSSFQQHYDAQNCFRDRYLAVLLTCKSRSISFNEGSKAKALAAAWARNDCQSAEKMLGIPDEEFALKEVLKAVTILDAARAKRAYEKTLRRLEAQGCKKKLRILQVRSLIGSISPDILPVSDSFHLCKKLRSSLYPIHVLVLEFVRYIAKNCTIFGWQSSASSNLSFKCASNVLAILLRGKVFAESFTSRRN